MRKTYTLALIACSLALSCSSSGSISYSLLPVPPEPVELPVRFEEATHHGEQGLFLSDANYRNLEKNIIRLRSYNKQLLLQIEYYRSLLKSNG